MPICMLKNSSTIKRTERRVKIGIIQSSADFKITGITGGIEWLMRLMNR